MADIEFDNNDLTPKCPYCEKEITTIERIQLGSFNINYVFLCPNCRKILSISSK